MLFFAASCMIAFSAYRVSPAARNPAFLNSNTDTVDGVSFSTATEKKVYNPGDFLMVRYRIVNNSMGTVIYDFRTSCQLKLEVIGADGSDIFSRLVSEPPSDQPHGCAPGASQLALAPSAEKILGPVSVPLTLKNADTLTVKALMAGYPLSAVSVKVIYRSAPAPAEPVALEWSAGNRPKIEFNSETKMLIIRVARAQRLTISAFLMTGQKINKLSCEKFLAPGTHQISFNNPKLAEGVVIFKVEGAGFSETKTINLAR
ncbi:MAG: hypothetical protein JW768_16735 [Chitinispirillaceae bacterium]|nr:hypothetical protein [Chitinispirillaceae bacterium]